MSSGSATHPETTTLVRAAHSCTMGKLVPPTWSLKWGLVTPKGDDHQTLSTSVLEGHDVLLTNNLTLQYSKVRLVWTVVFELGLAQRATSSGPYRTGFRGLPVPVEGVATITYSSAGEVTTVVHAFSITDLSPGQKRIVTLSDCCELPYVFRASAAGNLDVSISLSEGDVDVTPVVLDCPQVAIPASIGVNPAAYKVQLTALDHAGKTLTPFVVSSIAGVHPGSVLAYLDAEANDEPPELKDNIFTVSEADFLLPQASASSLPLAPSPDNDVPPTITLTLVREVVHNSIGLLSEYSVLTTATLYSSSASVVDTSSTKNVIHWLGLDAALRATSADKQSFSLHKTEVGTGSLQSAEGQFPNQSHVIYAVELRNTQNERETKVQLSLALVGATDADPIAYLDEVVFDYALAYGTGTPLVTGTVSTDSFPHTVEEVLQGGDEGTVTAVVSYPTGFYDLAKNVYHVDPTDPLKADSRPSSTVTASVDKYTVYAALDLRWQEVVEVVLGDDADVPSDGVGYNVSALDGASPSIQSLVRRLFPNGRALGEPVALTATDLDALVLTDGGVPLTYVVTIKGTGTSTIATAPVQTEVNVRSTSNLTLTKHGRILASSTTTVTALPLAVTVPIDHEEENEGEVPIPEVEDATNEDGEDHDDTDVPTDTEPTVEEVQSPEVHDEGVAEEPVQPVVPSISELPAAIVHHHQYKRIKVADTGVIPNGSLTGRPIHYPVHHQPPPALPALARAAPGATKTTTTSSGSSVALHHINHRAAPSPSPYSYPPTYGSDTITPTYTPTNIGSLTSPSVAYSGAGAGTKHFFGARRGLAVARRK